MAASEACLPDPNDEAARRHGYLQTVTAIQERVASDAGLAITYPDGWSVIAGRAPALTEFARLGARDSDAALRVVVISGPAEKQQCIYHAVRISRVLSNGVTRKRYREYEYYSEPDPQDISSYNEETSERLSVLLGMTQFSALETQYALPDDWLTRNAQPAVREIEVRRQSATGRFLAWLAGLRHGSPDASSPEAGDANT
jgi:hypothetical protein